MKTSTALGTLRALMRRFSLPPVSASMLMLAIIAVVGCGKPTYRIAPPSPAAPSASMASHPALQRRGKVPTAETPILLPMYPVASLDGWTFGWDPRIVPMGAVTFILSDGRWGEIQGDDVVLESRYSKGMPSSAPSPHIFGSWPEHAFVTTIPIDLNTSRGGNYYDLKVYDWMGSQWSKARHGPPRWPWPPIGYEELLGVQQWTGDRGLALIQPQCIFLQVAGPRDLAVPINTEWCVDHCAWKALPSGDVFMACLPDDKRSVLVRHWRSGEAQASSDSLPVPESASNQEIAFLQMTPEEGDAFLVVKRSDGGSFMSRHDGKTWSSWSPVPIMPEAGSALQDGSLLIYRPSDLNTDEDNALWHGASGGDWTPWTITALAPRGPVKIRHIQSLWVRGPDNIWAIVAREGSVVILHTRRPARVIDDPAFDPEPGDATRDTEYRRQQGQAMVHQP